MVEEINGINEADSFYIGLIEDSHKSISLSGKNENIKILLVEDNEIDILLIKNELKNSSYKNATLIVAGSLTEALKYSKENIQLFLLDLNLPDSKGMETLRRVHSYFPDTAIIVLTGLEYDSISLESIREGAQNYLNKKNIDREILEETIQFSLERQNKIQNLRIIDKKLIENKFLLEKAQQIAHMGSWVIDLNAETANLSNEAQRICGISSGRFDNKQSTFFDIIHPDDAKQLNKKIEECSPKKSHFDLTHRIIRKDRAVRWVISSGEISFDHNRHPRLIIGSIQDITESRESAIKLKESELRYKSLIDQASDAIYIADSSLKIIEANQSAVEMFGYSKAELLQMHISDFVDKRDLETNPLKIDELRSGKTVRNERRVTKKNREKTDVEVSGKMLEDGRFILFAREITERKNTEIKLTKFNRLYSVISHINKMITRLKDENSLFDEACNIVVEQGKFKMAWIGIANPENRKIKLVSSCGATAEDIRLLENKTFDINGPTEKVLNGLDYYATVNIQEEEGVSWRKYAAQRGFISAIILPIKKSGKVVGTLDMYSSETNFFDSDEIKMLLEVAGDISFGLEIFEKERKKNIAEALVIKNERRFRALIEKSADMKTISNKEGKILYGSPSVEKWLGYSMEEFLNKYPHDLIHPDEIADYLEKRNEIFKVPGKSMNFQQRRLHKNGNWIWCEGTTTNMLDDPAIKGVISNFRDISDRKTEEQKQQFERSNLNALINNTDDLMWSVDREFKLITANQPFDESIKHLSGKKIEKGEYIFSDKLPKEQLSKYKGIYERAFAGETFTDLEHGDNPDEVWREISYHPIRSGNKIIGTACFSRDITKIFQVITKRELAEKNLTQSESRFREFFDSAPNAIVIYDIETNLFVKFNDNALKLLKYSSEKLLRIGPSNISPEFQPDGRSSKEKAIEFNMSTFKGDKPAFDWVFIDANGKEIFCEVRIASLTNISGPQIIASYVDITERKSADKEREKITSDLAQRNKDLEQFTYIVSHNLRAPVANILGISKVLTTIDLNEAEKEELMYGLSASIIKLNGVILDLNNILQTKRNLSEVREVVSFSHMVKNIKISIDDQIREEQVDIITDFSEVDKMLTLKSYLYSIFYNFISNSIKYRQPDFTPVIKIKSYRMKDRIEIHFEDNGLGIDLGKKSDEVFGLYKRFHTHKEGKGMGLFMIKTQVEALGGKVGIVSEVNKGTVFIIQFPI